MFERPRALRRPSRRRRDRRLLRRAQTIAGRRPRLLAWVGSADQRALVALRTRGHSPATVRTVQVLGIFGELGLGWAALGLIGAARSPERREQWLTAAAAGPGSALINYGIKLAVGRERPLIEDHPPLAKAPSKLSFPSAHSTSSVAGSTALGRVGPTAKPALYGLAAAICLGRPYLGMHYPSDVLAGVVVGRLLGRAWPIPPDVPAVAPQATSANGAGTAGS